MKASCARCTANFEIDQAQLDFLERVSIRLDELVLRLPAPTHCPACRLQRRLAHRNQNQVVQIKSASTGQSMFSMFPGNPPFPVISNEEWYGEQNWSPDDFGREIDFSRPFFEQWKALRDVVPRPAICGSMLENSGYCNNASGLKNCYFVFDASYCEDCYYLETGIKCRDCIDCSQVSDCELCYDCVGCVRCYGVQSSESSVDCRDSLFLRNCRSCKNCIGCINLRHREYCILNIQYSRAEYEAFLASNDFSSYSKRADWVRKCTSFFETQPHPHILGSRIENCVGNHIHGSKSVKDSFFVYDSEDIRFGFIVSMKARDCQDYTVWGEDAELIYECCVCGRNIFNLVFCMNCWEGSSNLIYCDYCIGSSNCFGSIGLKKKSYYILNKHYSKSDYEKLAGKLVAHMRETGEWGEFFPMQTSLHPYNTTLAQRYFPLSENDCAVESLDWASLTTSTAKSLPAAELSDSFPPNDDSIVLAAARSNRIFKITSQEIKRLRAFKAPLPREAYDERMSARALRLGGISLHSGSCAKTSQPFQSVYSKDSPFKVWEKGAFDKEFD